MTVLILIAALALDVVNCFFNRAGGQNGADARALAAAINCAKTSADHTTLFPP